ncbi:DUF6233 domain-containing protein [Streptomyces sp. NPDC090741]|uniref:DUF6233 domain-containing protein n=1 Tax=Streptomyces sp. NPDC090741 TaxID=3365967 RepID=UPI00380A7A1D
MLHGLHRPDLHTAQVIELGFGHGRTAVLVHTAGCRLATDRTRPATRAQALHSLRHPAAETCAVCGAGRELGVTDP